MRRFFRLTVAVFALALGSAGTAVAAPIVVSLTFDDGIDSQFSVRSVLAEHGMAGTFYVNTNHVSQRSDRMTWQQLAALNADGHEIGGHTLDHVTLWNYPLEEQRRQVCDDRQNLLNQGFVVTSFAYPFGAIDNNGKQVVRECGYSSGRGAYGLRRIDQQETDLRPFSIPIPPADPFGMPIPFPIDAGTTLSMLTNYLTSAEDNGGGWVILLFHGICGGADCGGGDVSPAFVSGVLDWLSARGTAVKTVGQVISGDTAPPASSAACNGGACSSGWYTGPVVVSLASSDSGSGVARVRYTLDGSEPTVLSPLYTGSFAVSATTTVKFRAWDNAGNVEGTKSQLIRIDGVAPTSTIACNGGICSAQPYDSAVSVTLSAADNAGGSGISVIRYTTDGSTPTSASQAYTGAFTVSSTATVRFRAWDNAGNVEPTRSQLIEISTAPPGDTQPPATTIACNGSGCSTGWYRAPVSVTLAASDDQSGVAAIRYTLDGSEPTSSSAVYTGPFGVSSTTTVRFRAWDNAGNVEATQSQLIRVDTVAPTVVITSPSNGSAVKGNTRISADASDAGSGVVSVSFYANGVLIGTKTSAPYFVNWQTNKLKGTFTLTAVATDAAGNTTTSAAVVVSAG